MSYLSVFIIREKAQLHRLIDKLSGDVQESKDKCDELREARQDAARELLSLQDQHHEEIRLIRADLQDEASSREGMDKRLNDLRAEVCRFFLYKCNYNIYKFIAGTFTSRKCCGMGQARKIRN